MSLWGQIISWAASSFYSIQLIIPSTVQITKMKTNFFYSLIALLFFALQTDVRAQKTVSGIIKDKTTGESLPGVNIIIEGILTGAVSAPEGKFFLKTNCWWNEYTFIVCNYIWIQFCLKELRLLETSYQVSIILQKKKSKLFPNPFLTFDSHTWTKAAVDMWSPNLMKVACCCRKHSARFPKNVTRD